MNDRTTTRSAAQFPRAQALLKGTEKTQNPRGVEGLVTNGSARSVRAPWLDKRKALGFTGRQLLFCPITASKDGSLKPGSPLSTAYARTM